MDLLFTESDAVDGQEPAPPPTHDIVHELTIAAEPAAVFDALTTASGLASWWDDRCDTPLEAGRVVSLPVGDETIAARAELLERPDVVQWECVEGPREWVGTTVAFRIDSRPPDLVGEDVGDGPASVVRFWHGGWLYEDGLLPRASFEWAMLLDRLRRHLTDGTGRPDHAG